PVPQQVPSTTPVMPKRGMERSATPEVSLDKRKPSPSIRTLTSFFGKESPPAGTRMSPATAAREAVGEQQQGIKQQGINRSSAQQQQTAQQSQPVSQSNMAQYQTQEHQQTYQLRQGAVVQEQQQGVAASSGSTFVTPREEEHNVTGNMGSSGAKVGANYSG
ncbi:unnamed protein product, partial [Amoebophrya sp. A25]